MKLHYGKTILFIAFLLIGIGVECIRYEPTWESLDKRPLPQWYDDAKVGIFMHWGVYSVPAFGGGKFTSSEWFWSYWKSKSPEHVQFVRKNYPPNFSYAEFAPNFKAEFYDPKKWAKLFKKSGAKYVVLTSKHHDGYTLWPSKYSFNWNSNDVGPNRDLVGALFDAIRKNTDLRAGLYYSLYEWFHPLYLADREKNFTVNTFMTNKAYPEMLEIVGKYRPEIIWVDGDWEAVDKYWKSLEFLSWLYNDSPVKDTVVVNDRWGIGIPCNHGDFLTCKDRFNPGELQPFKWENAMTIDKHSWGYRRVASISDYLTSTELIAIMVETVSCGGNVLVNVGPTSDGRIEPVFEERLLELGTWLSVNGEAIYKTKPWKYQNDTASTTWYTAKTSTVYAITLEWPKDNTLLLGLINELVDGGDVNISLIGYHKPLKWQLLDGVVHVELPDKALISISHAWVVKITPTGHNSH